jgi:hypothetical protein
MWTLETCEAILQQEADLLQDNAHTLSVYVTDVLAHREGISLRRDLWQTVHEIARTAARIDLILEQLTGKAIADPT